MIKSISLYCCLFLALFIACNSKNNERKDTIVKFEEMRYSKLFGIAHFNTYSQLFYLQNNDTVWSITSNELKNNASFVVLSSVFSGFLNALNSQHQIVGVDKIAYYNDSILINRFQSGKILEVGEEGQLKLEKLATLKADYIISSSFSSSDRAIIDKLKKIGTRLIACDNFKEQHPLARAEWIKFFGFISGKLNQSVEFFNSVDASYKQITSTVKHSSNSKPLVMTDALYMGVWNIPGGNSYTAQLIKDAGGVYTFEDKKEHYTFPLNFETVYSKAQNADIWINVNQIKSFDELIQSESRYSLFKPFNSKNIFNYNKRENINGGNDFWETGVVRPDMVLADLVSIFSMDKNKQTNLFFYKRLN